MRHFKKLNLFHGYTFCYSQFFHLFNVFIWFGYKYFSLSFQKRSYFVKNVFKAVPLDIFLEELLSILWIRKKSNFKCWLYFELKDILSLWTYLLKSYAMVTITWWNSYNFPIFLTTSDRDNLFFVLECNFLF